MPSSETIYRTAWLLMHDPEFLKQNLDVSPQVFPKGPLRYLVDLSLRNWRQHHQLLTRAVVDLASENEEARLKRNDADPTVIGDIFNDLALAYYIDGGSLPSVRAIARGWLEKRTFSVAIDRAGLAAERDDYPAAQSALLSASLRNRDRTQSSLSPASPDHMQNIAKLPRTGMPLGITDLDKSWDGGYRPGEMGMILAPTGVGKSMIMCHMAAEALWTGAKVFYYTSELTPDQIKERTTLALLKKGKSKIRQPWPDELKHAAKRQGLNNPPDFLFDVRGDSLTWPDFLSDMEDFKAQHAAYPDLVLLDSADDIAPLEKRERTYEQLRDAFTRLRQVTIEKKLRVWTTGQATRDAVDKARLSLRNVGDAFAKAQRCHYVLGFSQTDQDRKDVNGPRVQMYVLKDSLHGTTGARLTLGVEWGHGDDGYPGLDVVDVTGLY